MNIRFWMALAAAHGSFSLGAAVLPGDPAPDLAARDSSGTTVTLSAYRQNKCVALLAIEPNHAADADWPGTNRRLAALGTIALFVSTDTPAGKRLFENASAGTLLIDRSGVVRRLVKGRVLTGTDLVDFVELWQSGKAYFVAYCARCHGEDGSETLCVDKPLTGVGQRLSPEQIFQSLRIAEANDLEVYIRGEMIKRSQLDAIIVYVSGM